MSYSQDIDKFIERLTGNVLQVTRETAFEVHDEITKRTPIDTGRAKSSWNIVEGETPNLDVTPPLVDEFKVGFGLNFIRQGRVVHAAAGASPLTADQAESVAKQQQADIPDTALVMTISNNLDYIQDLELGSSKQARQGMVAITVADFKNIVDDKTRNIRP